MGFDDVFRRAWNTRITTSIPNEFTAPVTPHVAPAKIRMAPSAIFLLILSLALPATSPKNENGMV